MASESLTGAIQVLFVFDVCEEIRFGELRRTLGVVRDGDAIGLRKGVAPHPSPQTVRFERPPLVEQQRARLHRLRTLSGPQPGGVRNRSAIVRRILRRSMYSSIAL